MKVRQIIDEAVPLSRLAGRTPGQVVWSIVSTGAKREDGLVTRTGKVEFRLNPKRRKVGA
jgi:hypothetical protein